MIMVDVKSMFLYNRRLETFKDWPFEAESGAKCTRERLAYSGFYRPNPESEPDLARCFMCHKELEGWEITDDPEVEHVSHSSKCPFLSFKVRDTSKMTIKDFFKLIYTIQIQDVSFLVQSELKKLKEEVEKNVKEQRNLLDP